MKKWEAICKGKSLMFSCKDKRQLGVAWRYSMLLLERYEFFGDRRTCRAQLAMTFVIKSNKFAKQ